MKKVIDTKDIKTGWNLKLLYDSIHDKRIKEDMAYIENEAAKFHEKYYGRKDYLRRIDLIGPALRDYTKISNILDANKPLYYLFLLYDLESGNENIQVMLSKYMERTLVAYNKVQFFWYAVGNIPENRQKRFLKNKKLSFYHRVLEGMFYNKHNLSEKEEEVDTLNMMSSYVWWLWLGEKACRKIIIDHGEKSLSLSEAIGTVPGLLPEQRIQLQEKINQGLKNVAWATHCELNAIIGNHKTMDNRRKYSSLFSSATHSDEVEDKVIKRLIQINTDAFPVAHRFYELHAKLLGMEQLGICDVRSQIGEMSFDFSYENIANIRYHAFKAFNLQCAKWSRLYLKNGQVDVFPKPGKSLGSYCMYGGPSFPTYVYLNYCPCFNCSITNAHEDFHGFHGEWSKHIRISMLRDHSMALAEAASTFGEKLFCDYIFKLFSPEDQIIALHVMLLNEIDMVFKQTAFFNYEMDLHHLIRRKGAATEWQMADLLRKNLQEMYGPIVNVKHDDGYAYVCRSHLRTPFYHSAYPFGDAVSEHWFSEWKKDKHYSVKIIEILSAGSRIDVGTMLKKITNVDVGKKDFFKTKITKISAMIDQLEALTIGKKK